MGHLGSGTSGNGGGPVAAFLAATLVLVGACSDGSDAGATPSATTGTGDCLGYGRSLLEKAGGPLQVRQNSMTFGMTPVPPGSVRDATLVPLVNPGTTSVLIDSVAFVRDPRAAPLRLLAAFVAPPHVVEHIVRSHPGAHWPRAVGYCLDPNSTGTDTPVLALRFATPTSDQVHGRAISRNDAINVHYRTPDGQRWVSAYPVRFSYPNRG
ncbi:hypothetical protein [Nocardioides sp.]|uniref:hypothetical protein n=1 Tax=Nocardioides sp. TaxID=35761 RepID=UPI00378478DE